MCTIVQRLATRWQERKRKKSRVAVHSENSSSADVRNDTQEASPPSEQRVSITTTEPDHVPPNGNLDPLGTFENSSEDPVNARLLSKFRDFSSMPLKTIQDDETRKKVIHGEGRSRTSSNSRSLPRKNPSLDLSFEGGQKLRMKLPAGHNSDPAALASRDGEPSGSGAQNALRPEVGWNIGSRSEPITPVERIVTDVAAYTVFMEVTEALEVSESLDSDEAGSIEIPTEPPLQSEVPDEDETPRVVFQRSLDGSAGTPSDTRSLSPARNGRLERTPTFSSLG
ncbi:hypothetical protein EK21DRAFT_84142 [Setomelanomma holmii]|uniref:Uncharacterized protein n=1 Tax=Setomelanomma holmii TaxID=210430 RepID=A0A9P4HI94_9PLEO|nr:hypothetical protein EK21DRAFT_84142 [Setomelanomma holmii]